MTDSKRVIITKDPYEYLWPSQKPNEKGIWPAHWISYAGVITPPFVVAYRRCFSVDKDIKVRIHVTADERYDLFLDGRRIGVGPERGDVQNWFFETYELNLSSGPHIITAKVWSLGDLAPQAQISLKHGFLLAAEKPLEKQLATGLADWEAKQLQGYNFQFNETSWGVGPDETIDGSQLDWQFTSGESEGWSPVCVGPAGVSALRFSNYSMKGHMLRPATLPVMMRQELFVGVARHVEEIETEEETWRIAVNTNRHIDEMKTIWDLMLKGESQVVVEQGKILRIIIDLQNYYCAYPHLVTSGGDGASIRIHWAESLYESPQNTHLNNPKGNRDEIESKYFIGVGDVFKPDGGNNRVFEKLWWRSGRYIELLIRTGDEPLVIEKLFFEETRYPLEMKSSFDSSEDIFQSVWPIMIRTMQMCSHETFLDCPYYEQLMYIGDSRLTALNSYCMTRDNSLVRKVIQFFDFSRIPCGFTRSQYPSRVMQIIPPFSMWWVAMVYDYAMWRDDKVFIKQRMQGVRAVIDAFLNHQNKDGLIGLPQGWNFVDWVPDWADGVPPTEEDGVSAMINWQFVFILTMVVKLEKLVGEDELAERASRLAREIADCLIKNYWDEHRRLFADDISGQCFSEHTQCLAVLSGLISENISKKICETLFAEPCLAHTTIYFSYYFFEVCRLLGRIDKFFERMNLWFDLSERGFKTTYEEPGNTRSDCHAWGTHPMYHAFATILGIRPASFGFKTVKIRPQLGRLNRVEGTLVHPSGEIMVKLHRAGSSLTGVVNLPENISGQLIWKNCKQSLGPGNQKIEIFNNFEKSA